MSASSRSVFRPLIAAGAVVALSGGSLLLLAAPAGAVSPGCALAPAVAQVFAAGSSASYVVPANVYALDVVAQGGAGAGEDPNVPGGAGAEVTTTLDVSPGESLAIDVATSSSSSVGGLSGGAGSAGAGSITVTTTPPTYSGGGGGGSFISDGSTVLVAAGGGGGAGSSASGGSAAPTPSALVAAGVVSSGGDGVTADVTFGHGGTGGSAVPGTGGASASGYGVGPGFDGAGELGGNSFANPGGGSVGAGGGGGGFAGGGGGGGGGYGNGGGAGSSFSSAAYAIAESTAVTPSVAVTPEASPVFTTTASTTFHAGSVGTFSLCAASPVAVTLSETGGLPSGVVFTDNGDGTATLSGTSSATGTYPITITATSANGSSTQSFVLTVDPRVLASTGIDPSSGGIIAFLLIALGGAALGVSSRVRRLRQRAL
jgi:hypothetical protein